MGNKNSKRKYRTESTRKHPTSEEHCTLPSEEGSQKEERNILQVSLTAHYKKLILCLKAPSENSKQNTDMHSLKRL